MDVRVLLWVDLSGDHNDLASGGIVVHGRESCRQPEYGAWQPVLDRVAQYLSWFKV
jgi:hypothetical protein